MLRNLNLSDEVYDIEWSPYCSTMFASTARDGRLEMWDLSERSLDPIYVDWYGKSEHIATRTYPARTCVKFNPHYPVLVSGNVDGQISAYRIFGYESRSDFKKIVPQLTKRPRPWRFRRLFIQMVTVRPLSKRLSKPKLSITGGLSTRT